jgi:hypothetical protein
MPYHVLQPTRLGDRTYMPGEQLPDDVDRPHVLVQYGYVTPIGKAAGQPEGAGLGGPSVPTNPETERRIRQLEERVDKLIAERADHDLRVEEAEAKWREARQDAETLNGELLAAREEAERLRARADAPPSIPAPMRQAPGALVPERDMRPATPEQIERHEARQRRAEPPPPPKTAPKDQKA